MRKAHAQIAQHARTPQVPSALQGAQRGIQHHMDNRQALGQAAAILANALCYLTAYPQDSQERWTAKAPPKLTQQTGEGSAAQKRSALSKLWALGHTRVQVLGEEFEHQAQSGQGVAAHWRRGHWRRQAHGPSLSLRKLLWIRPTRVLGEGVPQPSVLKVQPVARH